MTIAMRSPRHRTPRHAAAGALSAAAAGALLWGPALLAAQTATVSRVRNAPPNSCRQLTSTPSPLVGSPEGMVVLKMQHALSAASAAAPRTDSAGAPETRKVAFVRQQLDSLARVLLRDSTGRLAGGNGEPVRFTMTGDAQRGQFEIMLRQLEPMVSEIARSRGPLPLPLMAARPNAAGYMGVTSNSFMVTTNFNGVETVGYCDYPVVESVEPGSPAEKAGLLAGDTLLAYNGRDLREYDVNYGELLVPGQAVKVRFRRNGRVRDIPVTIVRRPDEGRTLAVTAVRCREGEPRTTCETRMVAAARGGFIMPSRVPVAVAAAQPQGGEPLLRLSFTPGVNYATFGGAQVTPITDELAANLGVKAGLLVMNVVPSTIAAETGLRAGEVITEVNGTAVRDMTALEKAFFKTDRSVTLQVSNHSSGTRTVVLRK